MEVEVAGSVAGMARPTLRPGLRVVRRDDRHLQLGLDDPERLVLPDQPGLREALERPGVIAPPPVTAVLDRLAAGGWVVDADREWREGQERRARRPPVAVHAHPSVSTAALRACEVAGVRVREPAPGLTRLVLSLGEPSRALADELMRQDVPHLWVAALPGRVRVGPFVQPGRTACLRCVDAHLGERDPQRGRVLVQLEHDPPQPHPADPGLLALAASWAACDLVRSVDGEAPALGSTTVTVAADLIVTRQRWLRHPHCGCAWG